jgi:serine/threonine protein kinase
MTAAETLPEGETRNEGKGKEEDKDGSEESKKPADEKPLREGETTNPGTVENIHVFGDPKSATAPGSEDQTRHMDVPTGPPEGSEGITIAGYDQPSEEEHRKARERHERDAKLRAAAAAAHDFTRERQQLFRRSDAVPLNVEQYFNPGKSVLEGLCQVEGKIGAGGMCHVYSVNTDLWEVARHLMLRSEVGDLAEKKFGIKKGTPPTEEQVMAVDDWVGKMKHIDDASHDARSDTASSKRISEIMLVKYVHEKLKEGRAALKVLDPVKASDEREGMDYVRRFRQEAWMMKDEFDHPDIIKVVLYFEVDGYHCMLEELVEGAESLDNIIQKGTQLSAATVTDIVKRTYGAICHSHDKKIAWRDCAPKNILVKFDDEGTAAIKKIETELFALRARRRKVEGAPEKKAELDSIDNEIRQKQNAMRGLQRNLKVDELRATDWGIAKPKTEKGIEHLIKDSSMPDISTSTKSGKIVATPSYSSPEQIRDPKSVDYPTDFFSLGITYYKLVTGEVPWEGQTPVAIMGNIESSRPEMEAVFPNLKIAESRRVALQFIEAQYGTADESRLDEGRYVRVSEDVEDIIMMLIEKDEDKRIKRDYIAKLFKEIEDAGAYEKRIHSPADREKLDKKLKAMRTQLKQREEATGAHKGRGSLDDCLDIAAEYGKLARMTPRETEEGVMPDVSREDLFSRAVWYYHNVLGSFDPSATRRHVTREDIENAIHRLECHLRVERLRIDQYALEKASEGTAATVRDMPQFVDDDGKPMKSPHWSTAFLPPYAIYKVAKHSKAKKRYDADYAAWVGEVNAAATSILNSALGFIEKDMYIAARKKLDQAQTFCDEHYDAVSKNIYQRKDQTESYFQIKQRHHNLVSEVAGEIVKIERSVKKKRFQTSGSIVNELRKQGAQIDRLRGLVSQLSAMQKRDSQGDKNMKRAAALIAEFEKAASNYYRASTQYNKLTDIMGRIDISTKRYDGIELTLAGEKLFSKDELFSQVNMLQSIHTDVAGLASVAGERYCAELDIEISAFDGTDERIGSLKKKIWELDTVKVGKSYKERLVSLVDEFRGSLIRDSNDVGNLIEDFARELKARVSPLDREAIGSGYASEFDRMVEDIEKRGAEAAGNLAAATYSALQEKVQNVEELMDAIKGRGSTAGGPTILAKAGTSIDFIEGKYGRGNIPACAFAWDPRVKPEEIKSLDERIEKAKADYKNAVDKVARFVALRKLSQGDAMSEGEIGDVSEATVVSARKELAEILIKEQGDLESAWGYFKDVPKGERDPERAEMFEIYNRTRKDLVKRIPGKLDQADVVGLDTARKTSVYNLQSADRVDTAFDNYLARVCAGLDRNPSEITTIRDNIDQLREVKDGLVRQVEESKAKPGSNIARAAKEARVKVEEMAGGFYAAVQELVTSALERLNAEGMRQPKDIQDYLRLAERVEDDHAGAAASYYDKYFTCLAPTNPERRDMALKAVALYEKHLETLPMKSAERTSNIPRRIKEIRVAAGLENGPSQ